MIKKTCLLVLFAVLSIPLFSVKQSFTFKVGGGGATQSNDHNYETTSYDYNLSMGFVKNVNKKLFFNTQVEVSSTHYFDSMKTGYGEKLLIRQDDIVHTLNLSTGILLLIKETVKERFYVSMNPVLFIPVDYHPRVDDVYTPNISNFKTAYGGSVSMMSHIHDYTFEIYYTFSSNMLSDNFESQLKHISLGVKIGFMSGLLHP